MSKKLPVELTRIERHAFAILRICEENKFLVSEMLVLAAFLVAEVLSKLPPEERLKVRNWFDDRIDSAFFMENDANG